MIGLFMGVILFIVGGFLTLFINSKKEVPMGGDFWDMPLCVKIGILLVISGILIFCGSIMYLLITNPGNVLEF